MESKMVKNQHVVPKSYLKLFENSNKRIFTYNWKSGLSCEKRIDDVCCHNYTYELSNGNIDNLLENELAKLESQFMPAIHNILKHVNDGNLNRSCIDSEICYKYIMLQYMRTDSGRILFGNALSNLTSLNHHISLDEINQNKDKEMIFNSIFRKNDVLTKALDLLYQNENPLIKVGVSEDRKLLTSDNPVFTLYFPNNGPSSKLKFMLPISPHVCLYFIGLDFNREYQCEQECFPYKITKNLAIQYNQALVNVSNYWIVSQDKFDVIDYNLIYNRRTK